MKRTRLPRPEYATAGTVLIALFAVAAALYGNVKMRPEYLVIFLQYFIPSMALIFALLNRKYIFEFSLTLLKRLTERYRTFAIRNRRKITHLMEVLHEQEFIFFSKGDDIATLNKVMMYVVENEVTKKIKIVTVLKEHQPPSEQFMRDFEVLDRAYPEIKMEYITIEGIFGPALIDDLCRDWKIPKNFMFISAPGEKFSYRVSELGGVRLVL